MRILKKLFSSPEGKWHLPALIIGLPMVLAILYYGLIAADRYVSESKIVIKRTAGEEQSASALGALMGAHPSSEDALYLREYILSMDMLKRLDKSLNLRKVFSETGLDVFYRLSPTDTQEAFLEYYRARVGVHYDTTTSLLTVTSQGFTAEFAQTLNKAILAESEKFVNDISNSVAREQMNFVAQEVERSRMQLDSARDSMLAYQNQHGMLDPLLQAEAAGKLITELEARQAQLETELRNLETYLNSDTPQVIGAKNAIKSLQAQIAQEKAKIAAPGNNKLNKIASGFVEIRSKLEFNTDLYKTALSVYEKSRVEVARKIKTLVVIVSPQKPERSNWRENLLNLVTLFFISIMLYGLVKLTWTVIEDHRE